MRIDEFGSGDIIAQEVILTDSMDRNSEAFADASPITYINEQKKFPPFLILHGNQDRVVPFAQSVRFYEALQKAGVIS